ncbi:uncharacterized protein TNCV_2737931 [Trichonephila clavipes]|nr:uncharacterized protein TNCV_2737931 [Trichonephila clavipes]
MSFMQSTKVIEEELMKEVPDVDELSILKMQISDKFARLEKCQRADNYPKAIAQLQERFVREDLLTQIYVRDLMSMVMRNAATERSKTDLPALYDELEAKIRALESLGWTQDKYGEFLSPLVESRVPDDILLAFERSKNFKEDNSWVKAGL